MEKVKNSKMTTIKKGNSAEIKTKNGGSYSYKYTDLAQIHEYLEQNNMRYIQQIKRIENEDYVMTKRCIDDKWEDEWLQGARVTQATLQSNNPAQEQGSALTYARRYSLLMAFGLATEDDDANSLTPNETKKAYITKLASEKQIETIKNTINKLINKEEVMNSLLKSFNVNKLEELTSSQASEAIQRLFQ